MICTHVSNESQSLCVRWRRSHCVVTITLNFVFATLLYKRDRTVQNGLNLRSITFSVMGSKVTI